MIGVVVPRKGHEDALGQVTVRGNSVSRIAVENEREAFRVGLLELEGSLLTDELLLDGEVMELYRHGTGAGLGEIIGWVVEADVTTDSDL